MSGMLMIWVVMLGGVVAERDRAHLTIPFLMEMLPGKLRRVIAVLVAVLSIALLLYMAWLGYRLAEMAQFKVTQLTEGFLVLDQSGGPCRCTGNGYLYPLLVNTRYKTI